VDALDGPVDSAAAADAGDEEEEDGQDHQDHRDPQDPQVQYSLSPLRPFSKSIPVAEMWTLALLGP
jgi:hypothetical protein